MYIPHTHFALPCKLHPITYAIYTFSHAHSTPPPPPGRGFLKDTATHTEHTGSRGHYRSLCNTVYCTIASLKGTSLQHREWCVQAIKETRFYNCSQCAANSCHSSLRYTVVGGICTFSGVGSTHRNVHQYKQAGTRRSCTMPVCVGCLTGQNGAKPPTSRRRIGD